jgi:hypothetical protein
VACHGVGPTAFRAAGPRTGARGLNAKITALNDEFRRAGRLEKRFPDHGTPAASRILGGMTDTVPSSTPRECTRGRRTARTRSSRPALPAPAFTLYATPDQTVSLSDFRGQPVVVAFYPADWSPVCGDQMALYNELLPDIPAPQRGAGRDLGRWSLVSMRRLRSIATCISRCSPTSSPRGRWRVRTAPTVRRMAWPGVRCSCSDHGGVIHWSYLSPLGINPGADGILERARVHESGAAGARP